MKYTKDDIVKGEDGVEYLIRKVDKLKNKYRAVPLKLYQSGLGDMFTCVISDEVIIKLLGKYTKHGIVLGGITC